MPIAHVPETATFFLHAGPTTYVIKVLPQGYLTHLYWGSRLATQDLNFALPFRERAFSPNPSGSDSREFSLDTIPLEYPVYGNTDFRSPALEILQPDGSRIVDLRFKDFRIVPGKPALAGLPATWVENQADAETLIVELEDVKLQVGVELCYGVFTDHPAISRSVRVLNQGSSPLT
ncbi:MAG TPA: glycoside hydrolase family 36 N-terminal domain-containing protein, partial [Terrimicrobiaceae bacterium]|nr:glycoside hydrolase family 36 N-terminal domain-containing protein [Terrimicrobiaceae bacterium]